MSFSGARWQMNTTLHHNRPEDTQNWTNLCLEPHDHRILYVNIHLRHQYGISVAESHNFLLAKSPQGGGARRNGGFRRLMISHFTCSIGLIKGAVSRNSAKLRNYKMPVKLRET